MSSWPRYALFFGAFCLFSLASWPLGQLAQAENLETSLSSPKGSPDNPFRVVIIAPKNYTVYDVTVMLFKEAINELGWGKKILFNSELMLDLDALTYEETQKKITNFLNKNQCDLLVSIGTEISVLVEQMKNLNLPILALSLNNPVTAGLVKGLDYSGNPNFTTIVFAQSPGLTIFTVFHHLLKFKKMGLLYHDSPAGRSIAFLEEARQIGRDRGFEVVEYNQVELHGNGIVESCRKGLDYLIKEGINAIYLASYKCFDSRQNDLKPFFKVIYDNKIMVLSAEERDLVYKFGLIGYLFSQSRKSVFEFQAKQAIQILEGKKPGDVLMKGNFTNEIILNLAAAEKLNLNLDSSFLSESDILYMELEGMKD